MTYVAIALYLVGYLLNAHVLEDISEFEHPYLWALLWPVIALAYIVIVLYEKVQDA